MEVNYRQIAEPIMYSITNPVGKKEFWNTGNERVCIFCGRNKEEVKFKKDAHIFPAGLGNRIYFNKNECDECNENFFSTYENDLCNFLMFDRIFTGAPKRKGYPKDKGRGDSYMIREGIDSNVKINIDDLEGRYTFKNDELNKIFSLTINKPLPYSEVNICKAITHIGWSFLDESLRNKYSFILKWLLCETSIFPLYYDLVFFPGAGFSKVIFEIREAINENSNFPIMFRFTFGTKILTFYLPKDTNVTDIPETDLIYIQLNNQNFEVERKQINCDKRIRPDSLKFDFKYTSASGEQEENQKSR
ncbi:HNH endonuclease [Bacillus spizizenii]|nr:HNH endonuclease [Bacillus spizizenii]